MTDMQFFSLTFGGWVVILFVLLWTVVVRREARLGSLTPAMVILGMTTCIPMFTRFGMSWMSLAMPFVGIAIGYLGARMNPGSGDSLHSQKVPEAVSALVPDAGFSGFRPAGTKDVPLAATGAKADRSRTAGTGHKETQASGAFACFRRAQILAGTT
jgi:hypothetical protein